MKYITYASHSEINGKIWAINSKKSDCYTHQLKRMVSQLDVMLEYHNKVLCIRFDLHCREYTATNKIISEFNRQLFQRLKSIYKLSRIGCLTNEFQQPVNTSPITPASIGARECSTRLSFDYAQGTSVWVAVLRLRV